MNGIIFSTCDDPRCRQPECVAARASPPVLVKAGGMVGAAFVCAACGGAYFDPLPGGRCASCPPASAPPAGEPIVSNHAAILEAAKKKGLKLW